jgi:DNA-binding transcriptional LysR family regulator
MSLEEELGEPLFIRGKRGIVLTEAGAYLQKRAHEIISLTERTVCEMPHSSQEVAGDLHIGTGETPTIAYTVRAIRNLQARFPGIRMHFYNTGSRDIQLQWLENGFIDFALMSVLPATKRYFNVRLPLQDTWGLLMRKDDPLAAKPAITPEDMSGLPILSGRSENFRSLMSGWLGHDFNRLNLVGTSFLMTSTEHLVKEGVAYAIIRDGIMNEGITSSVCFRPFYPPVVSSVHLVWSSTRELTPLQELFLQEMRMQEYAAGDSKSP